MSPRNLSLLETDESTPLFSCKDSGQISGRIGTERLVSLLILSQASSAD
jgi:hypothetical protein